MLKRQNTQIASNKFLQDKGETKMGGFIKRFGNMELFDEGNINEKFLEYQKVKKKESEFA